MSTKFSVIYRRIATALTGIDPLSKAPENRKDAAVLGAAWIAYMALILFLSHDHAFFRDEVRALSIAKASHSIPTFIRLLHNEGHPQLWYVILIFLYRLFHANWVLPVASLSIMAVATWIWLWFSPFSLTEKLLFLLGVFPLVEYSVYCRNYGISVLLLFILASQYRRRLDRPARVFIPLALLGLTNVYGTIAATFLLASITIEALRSRQRLLWFAAPLISSAAMGCAMYFSLPDSRSIFIPPSFSSGSFVHSVISFFEHPAKVFYFGFTVALPFSSLYFWLLTLPLLRRPRLWIVFLLSALTMSVFSDLIYQAELRHQGILYALYLSLLWIVNGYSEWEGALHIPFFDTYYRRIFPFLFCILLARQAQHGILRAVAEIRQQSSSSRSLSTFVGAHPEYHNAIIMGEPEIYLESLPYYLDNPLYFACGQSFRQWALFTRDFRPQVSLGELLQAADGLQRKSGRPILILLGEKIDLEANHERGSYWHAFRFYWEPEEVRRFYRQVKFVHEFKGTLTDENYRMYALTNP